MAVTVELAIPRAARLPRCSPIVAVPLSACSPPPDAAFLAEARALGDFTDDQLSWIVYIARSYLAKDPSRTIDGCVEDAIERIGATEYVPDGFGGCV